MQINAVLATSHIHNHVIMWVYSEGGNSKNTTKLITQELVSKSKGGGGGDNPR